MASEPCDRCGIVYEIGDWPFCPHGRSALAVEPNDWPGGKTFEHLGHEPVTVYSKSELQREMDKRGLRHTDRWVPGDRHLTNWGAAIDAYTLENAKALVARQGIPRTDDPGRLETLTLTERHVTLERSAWD